MSHRPLQELHPYSSHGVGDPPNPQDQGAPKATFDGWGANAPYHHPLRQILYSRLLRFGGSPLVVPTALVYKSVLVSGL